MNREIKFRGFSKDKNEWVYGHYSNMKGTSKMLIDRHDSNSDNWVYKDMVFDQHLISVFSIPDYQGWDCGSQCTFHRVIPESVGQYTGLKDKNGKEIYEGDIVRCGTVGTIKFLEGRFIYDYTHPEDPEQLDVSEVITGEVIGNICQSK